MLQHSLDDFRAFRNGVPMRKDREKAGPSGISRNEAFSCFMEWGGVDLLQPVDVNVIRDIKSHMNPNGDLLSFVPAAFSARAQVAYDSLNVLNLSPDNIWHVCQAMHPLLA